MVMITMIAVVFLNHSRIQLQIYNMPVRNLFIFYVNIYDHIVWPA